MQPLGSLERGCLGPGAKVRGRMVMSAPSLVTTGTRVSERMRPARGHPSASARGGRGDGCAHGGLSSCRYKLLELLCYVVMGFFPAVVILSMASPPPAWGLRLPGEHPDWLRIVTWSPLLWQEGKRRLGVST